MILFAISNLKKNAVGFLWKWVLLQILLPDYVFLFFILRKILYIYFRAIALPKRKGISQFFEFFFPKSK